MKYGDEFLGVKCDVARHLNAVDWAATPMGPVEDWTLSFKSIVRTALSSRQPMSFWWGEELLQFHNDGYAPMLGNRVDRFVWDGSTLTLDKPIIALRALQTGRSLLPAGITGTLGRFEAGDTISVMTTDGVVKVAREAARLYPKNANVAATL